MAHTAHTRNAAQLFISCDYKAYQVVTEKLSAKKQQEMNRYDHSTWSTVRFGSYDTAEVHQDRA